MKSLRLIAVTATLAAMAVFCAFAGNGNTATTRTATPAVTQGCQQGHVFFAKTKFVFHAGLAFGAFHRYVWKPYKAGTFTGAHKKAAYVKAAIAILFIYHELKEARKDAMADKNLCKLGSALDQFGASLSQLGGKLKNGTASIGDIAGNSTLFDKLLALTGIKPHDVAVPGA